MLLLRSDHLVIVCVALTCTNRHWVTKCEYQVCIIFLWKNYWLITVKYVEVINIITGKVHACKSPIAPPPRLQIQIGTFMHDRRKGYWVHKHSIDF